MRMWSTFYMPAGATINAGAAGYGIVTKTGRRGEPFPWTTESGVQFSNEWAQQQINDGAVVTQPEGH